MLKKGVFWAGLLTIIIMLFSSGGQAVMAANYVDGSGQQYTLAGGIPRLSDPGIRHGDPDKGDKDGNGPNLPRANEKMEDQKYHCQKLIDIIVHSNPFIGIIFIGWGH